jgi:hypothetical protein
MVVYFLTSRRGSIMFGFAALVCNFIVKNEEKKEERDEHKNAYAANVHVANSGHHQKL